MHLMIAVALSFLTILNLINAQNILDQPAAEKMNDPTLIDPNGAYEPVDTPLSEQEPFKANNQYIVEEVKERRAASIPEVQTANEEEPRRAQLQDGTDGTGHVGNSWDETEAKIAEESNQELHPIAPNPFIPVHPIQKPPQCYKPPHTCCDLRETVVNLHRNIPGVINNLGPSVEVLSSPVQNMYLPWTQCGNMALLKVRFDKITRRYCPICLNYPGCGRRMLKVVLDLHKNPNERSSGYRRMFNIGDSSSNNGWGGDSGTQQNDAELDGKRNFLYMYPNDRCTRKNPWVFENALADNVTQLTIYIANDFIRITNDQGCDKEMCSGCFYALNGQPDSSPGGQNEEIFVALNRVVLQNGARMGSGVCRATLSWVCPWPVDCPYNPCSIKDYKVEF